MKKRHGTMVEWFLYVGERRKPAEIIAYVDTGFDGGLFCHQRLAQRAGIVLTRPDHYPISTLQGDEVPGVAGWGVITMYETGFRASTYVFCPDSFRSETLVGAHFLSRVGAYIGAGPYQWIIPRTDIGRQNPSAFAEEVPDLTDLSWMHVPYDTPRHVDWKSVEEQQRKSKK